MEGEDLPAAIIRAAGMRQPRDAAGMQVLQEPMDGGRPRPCGAVDEPTTTHDGTHVPAGQRYLAGPLMVFADGALARAHALILGASG